MKKLSFLGFLIFTLSVYGEDAEVAYSSTSNKQPVEKADAGPYDDDTDEDGDSQGDEQDEDVIQMEDDDSDSEDDSNSNQQ